jgi:hypothetical protein
MTGYFMAAPNQAIPMREVVNLFADTVSGAQDRQPRSGCVRTGNRILPVLNFDASA